MSATLTFSKLKVVAAENDMESDKTRKFPRAETTISD